MNYYEKYILPPLLNFFMKRKGMEKHRPAVAVQALGTVLEIGFGSGLNLPHYTNILKLYALDPSLELHNLAKRRIRTVSFPVKYIQASAESIPLVDNSIDTVVSTWTLCSIPNPDLALKEIFRVLKSGGKFVFIEHGKSSKKIVAKLQKWLTPISKYFTGGCHMDRKIDKLISNAGFTIENLETFKEKSMPLIFTYKGIVIAKKL